MTLHAPLLDGSQKALLSGYLYNLSMLERLHRLMDTARRTGWQASTGIQRSGEEAYVHARSGRPCRRCGPPCRPNTPLRSSALKPRCHRE